MTAPKPRLRDVEALRVESREYAYAQPDDGCQCDAWSRGECACGRYRDIDDYRIDFYATRTEALTAAIRAVLELTSVAHGRSAGHRDVGQTEYASRCDNAAATTAPCPTIRALAAHIDLDPAPDA